VSGSLYSPGVDIATSNSDCGHVQVCLLLVHGYVTTF
jgi:hypothetical protein